MKKNKTVLQNLVLTNDKFTNSPNIDQYLIDYVNKAKPDTNSDKWHHNLIGFYPFKKCNGFIDFGYNADDSIVYYPIFVGKADYELENEIYENPLLDVKVYDYVIMFYGIDNISHFLRFCELKSVQNFLNDELPKFNSIGDVMDAKCDVFYWYNS